MLAPQDLAALLAGRHPDPFSVLGPHLQPDGRVALRALLPGARVVEAVSPEETPLATLAPLGDEGFFEGTLPGEVPYRLRVRWRDGNASSFDDAYRIIVDSRGQHFDPDVVDAFVHDIETFKTIARTYAE